MANTNQISIIVASRNRPVHLKNLLNSLIETNNVPDELVLVDNDSDPKFEYEKIASSYQDKLPVKYVLEKKLGPNHARNSGLQNASHELIVFVDDDCEVTQNWLSGLVTPLIEDDRIGAVGGKIVPKYEKSFLNLFYHLINYYIQ